MAEKDITEKMLEAYNDVFSDIINNLILGGERLVSEDELEDAMPASQYKADGKVHEQERDVAKYWKKELLRIAFLGFENETGPDEDMVLRMTGYNGAAYRAQLLADKVVKDEDGKEHKIRNPRYPVFSFVLYFGTDRRWKAPATLRERMDVEIHRAFEPYFDDQRIHVFEIAWLDDEQVQRFTSDFRFVADFFVKRRKKQEYTAPGGTIQHVHELLQLMSVMTGDKRFEESYSQDMKGGVTMMTDVLDKVEEKGMEKGKLELLAGLVKKGILTLQQAADERSLTVDDFKKQCVKYNLSL